MPNSPGYDRILVRCMSVEYVVSHSPEATLEIVDGSYGKYATGDTFKLSNETWYTTLPGFGKTHNRAARSIQVAMNAVTRG